MVEDEVLIIIQDNREEIGLVKHTDMDKAKCLALGDSIFFKYSCQRSRLENILYLT